MPVPNLKSCVACLLVGAVIGASVAYAAQPHMVNALGSLQAARGELARAESNKGGHKERAIGLVDQAIQQVQAGIAFAGG
jgi:ribose/xylose/arabinose/galactoside ABC-type transport system permease subunit